MKAPFLPIPFPLWKSKKMQAKSEPHLAEHLADVSCIKLCKLYYRAS